MATKMGRPNGVSCRIRGFFTSFSKNMAKAQTPSTRGKRPKNGTMSWPQALRDMVVSAINRGQLPLLGFFMLLLMLVFKMPAEDVSRLVFELLQALRHGEFVAYILLVITAGGWFAHARKMRQLFSAEAERIGREKSKLQEQLAGIKFGSSDHK